MNRHSELNLQCYCCAEFGELFGSPLFLLLCRRGGACEHGGDHDLRRLDSSTTVNAEGSVRIGGPALVPARKFTFRNRASSQTPLIAPALLIIP